MGKSFGRPNKTYEIKVPPKTRCTCERPLAESQDKDNVVMCAKCGRTIRHLTAGRWDPYQ